MGVDVEWEKFFSKKKKCYNFFMMFFFDKNLKRGHKVTLCLLLVGVLANVLVLWNAPQIPFLEILPEEGIVNFSVVHIVMTFGTLVKCIALFVFRK